MSGFRWLFLLTTIVVAAGGVTAAFAEEEAKPAVPEKAEVKAVASDLLCQHWFQSYEEEKPEDNGQLFRPAGAKVFGASRFRMQYKFSKNGDCEWFWLAPDDGHKMRPGKWSLDPKEPTVVRIDTDQGKMSFRVVSLSKGALRLVMMERLPGQ